VWGFGAASGAPPAPREGLRSHTAGRSEKDATMAPTNPFRAALSAASCAAFGAVALAAPAAAQIVVGQTAGFTGTVAASVKEVHEGAKLYLDMVNARGGVAGQPIVVTTMDDKFDPKLAAENAKSLITEKGVVAIFLNRGTPHTEAIAPLLKEHKVPLLAPSTGAMVLHQPVNPYIFNVRATYQAEAERAVKHLVQVGLTKIAVVQVEDSFGADAMAGAAAGFAAAKQQPAVHLKFDRAKPDFSKVAPEIAKAEPQAVIFIGSGQAVADGTKAIRAAGSKAQIVTLSNNAAGGFVKLMGEHARGTIVTQVFPYERSLAIPIVKEAIDLAKAKGQDGVTPAMMEGFAAAKVLVEALKAAGPKPTRESLLAALNGMRSFDIGGMDVGFGPNDHTGLNFVDLSIIDGNGRFRR
jgi:branched-chain amino acid transport system substrate-binding protein